MIATNYVQDCETLQGMEPGLDKQYGNSEDRTLGKSNTFVTTFYSLGKNYYSRDVKEIVKDRSTMLILDEFDKTVVTDAGQRAFVKLFEKEKRFHNIYGLTATPSSLKILFNSR